MYELQPTILSTYTAGSNWSTTDVMRQWWSKEWHTTTAYRRLQRAHTAGVISPWQICCQWRALPWFTNVVSSCFSLKSSQTGPQRDQWASRIHTAITSISWCVYVFQRNSGGKDLKSCKQFHQLFLRIHWWGEGSEPGTMPCSRCVNVE